MSTTADTAAGAAPTGRWDRATVAMLVAFFAGTAAAAALVTALGKQVYDLSGRELDLGLLGLAEFAPAALLVLVTGTVADRFDRRRVAALGALGEAGAALAITLYVATSPSAVAPLFGLALVLGVARAFMAPASRSLPADTVPSELLPWLVARWTIVFQVALVFGPVLAGSLYAVDPRLPFAASTALFVVAAVGFSLLPPTYAERARTAAASPGARDESGAPDLPATAAAVPGSAGAVEIGAGAAGAVETGAAPVTGAARAVEPAGAVTGAARAVAGAAGAGAVEPAGAAVAATTAVAEAAGVTGVGGAAEPAGAASPSGRLHEAMEGLRLVRQQPILLGAISLDLFAVLFGGAVALLPAIAEERLGVGAVGFGWLRAAPGIGAAMMMLLLAIRPIRRGVGRTLLVTVAIFGAATVLLGVTTNYAVAFGALVVLAGADALSVFIRITLVPLVTPASARGRVMAVENVFIGASNELGAFESGVTGQLLGPGLAVGLGGVATLVVAAAWSRLFPALRAVDRFPTPVEP